METGQGVDETVPTAGMKRSRKFLRRVRTRRSSRTKVAPNATTDNGVRTKSTKVKVRVRRKKLSPKISADVVAALGGGSASARVGGRRVSRLSQAIASRRQRALQKREASAEG